MSIGEVVASFVLDPFVMMILGMLGNLFQRLLEAKDRGEPTTPLEYIKKNPYRVAISIIGLLVGYSVLIEMGQLTTLNALGLGYMSHSVIETLSSRLEVTKLKYKKKDDQD